MAQLKLGLMSHHQKGDKKSDQGVVLVTVQFAVTQELAVKTRGWCHCMHLNSHFQLA